VPPEALPRKNVKQFFFYLVCEAIGTAAIPGLFVPASGDTEDDCGETDGM
jgi:hypothetical protein